jgi:soluble lytic murein transglycosylase
MRKRRLGKPGEPAPRPFPTAATTPKPVHKQQAIVARMLPRLLPILFGGALLALSATTFPQTPAPPSRGIAAAIAAAERGEFDSAQFPDIAAQPLYGWVEYAALRRDIDTLSPARAGAFLDRYRGQAVAEAFRELWLAALARREDWPAFRAAWSPAIKSAVLRCAELNARQATGAADAQWTSDAQALWRSSGKPLPSECDAPFAVLAAKGGLPPALRWERIDLAAGEWNAAEMRDAARGLPAADLALANDYASFMDAVSDRALTWPKTTRSRWIASQGLARLGKSVPATAELQLPKYAQALEFSEADRGRVLYQIALWTVASYEPESARRHAAVPDSAYDDKLHEWQVREALARSDWKTALAAIRRMGGKQRSDSRWTYFEARLLELTGDKSAARAAYQRAAREPQFHGFLAADRIDQPYALCPWIPHDSEAAKAAVARDPAIVRAMALYRIDRGAWAQREWDDALSRFDDTQRRLAVEVAQDNGWFDRAVFSLGRTPDEQRLYELRFPLHHDATIRREAAKNNLDPAWVAAEIRAESVFNPNARSGANAMGLMQVLPGTGMAVARQIGVPWNGAQSLYDPDTNIVLGSAYLRQLLDKYGGQPYFAIAGYNAGPAPLARWQSQRPGMDPDFWIETISYKETREYVARVLAFSTVYDWRLNGNALPLTDRMRGRTTTARKQFTCPLASTPGKN